MLLAGVKGVEMGVGVAGPAAGGVMADGGADVAKTEPPQADPMRNVFQALAGIEIPSSPPFTVDNRGKRSVVLDLNQPEAREIALQMIREADVFLTNFRRQALERHRLDYESIKEECPRLVYGHVTGYGQEGPDRDRAGYDIGSFWARSGIANLLAPPDADGEPAPSRGGFGDHITAITCLGGIMAALFARERTGEGQLVDAALLRSGIYTIGWDIAQQIELGLTMSAGKRTESIIPTASNFKAGDGRWVWLLGVEAERHWPRLVEALGREDLHEEPRFKDAASRRENARDLMAILDAEFAKRPFDELTRRFDEVDLWWAPVQTPAEVLEDPQALASGAIVEIPGRNGEAPIRTVGSPVLFSKADVTPRARPPELGEHTEEVLRERGVTEEQIERLRAAGALG